MKAVAYDPATQTIRLCKLKRTGEQVLMTEAHEDVTEMCIRAVATLISQRGAVPMSFQGKAYVLGIIPLKEEETEEEKE